jgi:hypothetical protein
MTSEQIADLRRILQGTTVVLYGATADVVRVLDEREALLKALRDARVKLGDARSTLSHCWASETPPDHESVADADAAEDAAEAAIAKAEAP